MHDLAFDQRHLWHPYTSSINPLPCYAVTGAEGVHIHLAEHGPVIDGMSSWWAAIHGYNHPVLNAAVHTQTERFAHVMFGGLTHQPAISAAQKLLALVPNGMQRVFWADSGSVAMEVAMKMALQYFACQGQTNKHRFLTVRNGYHGDTFGAMSICDPINGMHSLFANNLPQHLFAPAPQTRFAEVWNEDDMLPLHQLLSEHHQTIAALVLEPIVQGAGGMRMYHPEYLRRARQLCDEFEVLLILDEIATGFGRTGKLFAAEHANISPDIMAVGKALTGGYLTLAATLCTEEVANGVCQGEPGVFMHGPTYMANPLACAVADASLSLLSDGAWEQQVQEIARQLHTHLSPLINHPAVADVRILGAIGVVECKQPLPVAQIQAVLIEHGVWLRPFGKLLYTMPPFICQAADIEKIGRAMQAALDSLV